MKKIILVSLILIVAVAGFLILRQNQNNPTPSQGINPAKNTVVINNFTFTPSTMTVRKGDTVTWQNEDSATHSIKSSSFNSTNLKQGATFQFTFNNPGTYAYNCGIHPTMTGIIVVE